MAELTDSWEIKVKLPRTHFDLNVQDVNSVPGLRGRFPGLDEAASLMTVHLHDSHHVVVEGYGKPFSNPGHPCDGWVNRNLPINDGITLLGLLEERQFFFVAPKNPDYYNRFWVESQLPPPFSYPYSDTRIWNIEKCQKELLKVRGEPFLPTLTFPDDKTRMAVVTQAVIQDVLWLAEAAAEVFVTKLSAYFVPSVTDQEGLCSRYYVIIPLPKEFLETYEQQWPALTDCESFKLAFHGNRSTLAPPSLAEEDDWKDLVLGTWSAKIVQLPKHVDVLAQHPTEGTELVLFVRRKSNKIEVPTFPNRSAANSALREDQKNWACVSLWFDAGLKECRRRVTGALQYLEGEKPSNKAPSSSSLDADMMMAFHRAIQRGTGFYDILKSSPNLYNTGATLAESMERLMINDGEITGHQLPTVSYLEAGDPDYIDALLMDVLPQDQARFRSYFGNRPLGLSIVTAGPGFGKTTVLSVATLSMASSLGPVYASAPSNVAVDNFAARLSVVDQKAVSVCNKGYGKEDPGRMRRRLIVRGYAIHEEVQAFRKLLQSPKDGDNAAPGGEFRPVSKWRLYLSASYWLLMILRSPAVRPLELEDNSTLWAAQEVYDAMPDLQRLRELATGQLEWKDFEGDVAGQPQKIQVMLESIIDGADILCTTPAHSDKLRTSYLQWKRNNARAIAIDEAANMNKADLDCVWGNTMLPCLLVGDEKQLQPAVMTQKQKDPKTGKFFNRHAGDGSISPLAFLKSTGWPVYRMLTQFRMARGLFDICHREMYSDIPFEYTACCNINLPQHAIGMELERFVRRRFPELAPPPEDELAPIFVHCLNTVRHKEKNGTSSINFGQTEIALDFLVSLVKETKIDPSQIGLITPYKATVDLIESVRRRKAEYLPLAPMAKAATVDSYQGREKSIIVVVMCTTAAKGPGFTTNKNRLNVLLSRHKSGLVIFGDINVVEPLVGVKKKGEGEDKDKDKGKGKGKKARAAQRTAITRGADGKGKFFHVGMLRNVNAGLVKSGRVATVAWVKKVI